MRQNTIERADGGYFGDEGIESAIASANKRAFMQEAQSRRITIESKPPSEVDEIDVEEKEYVTDMKTKYPGLEAAFREIQAEQYDLFCKKMSAYGLDNISLGADLSKPENAKMSLTGIWIRMMDKMNRLKTLVIQNNKNHFKDESVKDTYIDLSNYSIIAQIVLQDKWK